MPSSPAEAALVAMGAFASTNVDNLLVTSAQIAGARPDRVRRILYGQVTAAAIAVGVSLVAAALLFEVPVTYIGLLGLVPLAIGLRGLFDLRHPARRAERRAERERTRASAGGFFTALLITLGVSGDNLAVYIPIFRVGGVADGAATVGVFAAMEVVLCLLAATVGRHPATLRVLDRMGAVAIPLLYLAIGVLVLVRAHTFGL